jgi:dihydropyrimidinase
MFDAGVVAGRISLARFVELTATAPARSYGLSAKGEIAPGKDADIALWDAGRSVTIPDVLHDRTGYSPYAGRKITGWPMTVLRRGEVIVRDGELVGKPGSGKVLLRDAYSGATAGPAVAAELDPARNYGAQLI